MTRLLPKSSDCGWASSNFWSLPLANKSSRHDRIIWRRANSVLRFSKPEWIWDVTAAKSRVSCANKFATSWLGSRAFAERLEHAEGNPEGGCDENYTRTNCLRLMDSVRRLLVRL